MRETLEMITVSRMQNMVEIRKKNTYFVTILLFWNFGKSSFGALGVEIPHGGAISSHLTHKLARSVCFFRCCNCMRRVLLYCT